MRLLIRTRPSKPRLPDLTRADQEVAQLTVIHHGRTRSLLHRVTLCQSAELFLRLDFARAKFDRLLVVQHARLECKKQTLEQQKCK